MFSCPTCHRALIRRQTPAGLFLMCGENHGVAVAVPVLRKILAEHFIQQVWAGAIRNQNDASIRCPVCGKTMEMVTVPVQDQALDIDLCRSCRFVWFDQGELESLPKLTPRPPRNADLPQAAREALAMHEVQLIRERARNEESVPQADWRLIPGILGLPVEADEASSLKAAWMTWLVALLILAVSLAGFRNLQGAIEVLALVPADFLRYGGANLLTSFFLHGGWFHLLSNLYFLLLVGDNVEEAVGPWHLVTLLLAATVGGDLLHIAFEPRAEIPTLGASGGISGLIAFYGLRFPHARLGIMVRLLAYFRWLYLPAWSALLLWSALQVWGAIEQISGMGDVSALAHLGGAGVGLVYWLMFRQAEVRS